MKSNTQIARPMMKHRLSAMLLNMLKLLKNDEQKGTPNIFARNPFDDQADIGDLPELAASQSINIWMTGFLGFSTVNLNPWRGVAGRSIRLGIIPFWEILRVRSLRDARKLLDWVTAM